MNNIWSKENQQRIMLEHCADKPDCETCFPTYYGLWHLLGGIIVLSLLAIFFFPYTLAKIFII